MSVRYLAKPLEGTEPWRGCAQILLDRSGCKIRNYTSGRGLAYHVTGDGEWWISVPRPVSPQSFATFAHEVGHHWCGHSEKPHALSRYLEEQEAWIYTLERFAEFELPGAREVRERAQQAMGYAFGKRARRLKGEVTHARFPGVEPIFAEMLDKTIAAGPQGRFWYQYAGRQVTIPKTQIEERMQLVIGQGRPRIVVTRRSVRP